MGIQVTGGVRGWGYTIVVLPLLVVLAGCEPAIPPDRLDEMRGEWEVEPWGSTDVEPGPSTTKPEQPKPGDQRPSGEQELRPEDYQDTVEPESPFGPPSGTSDSDFGPTSGVSGTFSIVAIDPESGVVGGAVASKYPAVGRVVVFARGGVGAFATQHWHHPPWGPQALDLLGEGHAPTDVFRTLLTDDPRRERRQLAIVDAAGRTLNRNPTAAAGDGNWWGAASGKFYACQGNLLAGPEVLAAMVRAYETTQSTLADRLMAALLAGDCAGGDARGRLAAGIRVARPDNPGYWLELYVDKSDNAVVDLAEKYAELKHPAKGAWAERWQRLSDPCGEARGAKSPM